MTTFQNTYVCACFHTPTYIACFTTSVLKPHGLCLRQNIQACLARMSSLWVVPAWRRGLGSEEPGIVSCILRWWVSDVGHMDSPQPLWQNWDASSSYLHLKLKRWWVRMSLYSPSWFLIVWAQLSRFSDISHAPEVEWWMRSPLSKGMTGRHSVSSRHGWWCGPRYYTCVVP